MSNGNGNGFPTTQPATAELVQRAAPTQSAALFGTATQRRRVTQAEYNYLRSQATNILLNGGSEEDVARFLEHEQYNVPPRVPTRQTLEELNPPPNTPEKPSLLERVGLPMRVLQGVTLGFGDEAMGALLGVISGEGARAGIEEYRKEMDAWSKKHRKLGFAAELSGALLSGGPLLRLGLRGASKIGLGGLARVEGATLGQRAVQAVGAGGAFGAASAAGHTEGDISERSRAAIFGGVTGAAFGAGLVGAGHVVGQIVKPIARSVFRGSQMQQSFRTLSPQQEAQRQLAEALVKDGVNIDEALRRVTLMERTGTPIGVADIAGDVQGAVMTLARDAMRNRTPEKQRFLEALLGRQAEQGSRLTIRAVQSIFRSNRLGTQNAYEVSNALQAFREAESRPLYRVAHEQMVTLSERAQEILQQPLFRKAWEVGRAIANDEDFARVGHGLKVPKLPTGAARQNAINILRQQGVPEKRIPEMLAQMAKSNPAIAETFPTEVPVRGLDMMKRGLDNIIENLRKSGKALDKGRERALVKLREEVLAEADAQVPAFAQARAIYRGTLEAQRAIEAGKQFLKLSPENILKEMDEFLPAERDFYRVGAVQALAEKVMRVTDPAKTDVATRYFGGRLFGGSSLQARQLRALFPPGAEAVADDLMRMIAAEARISLTAQGIIRPAAGGVQQAVQAAEGTLPSVRATLPLLVGGALRGAAVKAQTRFAHDVADELALLFMKGLDDPNELRVLLESLRAVAPTRGLGGLRTSAAIGQTIGSAF